MHGEDGYWSESVNTLGRVVQVPASADHIPWEYRICLSEQVTEKISDTKG